MYALQIHSVVRYFFFIALMIEGYESSWLTSWRFWPATGPYLQPSLFYVLFFFFILQLSIDDISQYGDAYSAGNHGAAFSNLKVAMETANSSAVLPSVELSSSGGNSEELVYLIRKVATGNVQEFAQEGNLVCVGFS